MRLIEAMGIILDAVGQELQAIKAKEDLCLFTVMPGNDVPIDYAECGGMAWVRLVTAAPSSTFPNADSSPGNCASFLAYALEVGLLREAPMPQQFGSEWTNPSSEEQFDAAEKAADGMEAVYRALRSVGGEFPDFVVGTYTPYGPDGGAVGGTWAMTVGLD